MRYPLNLTATLVALIWLAQAAAAAPIVVPGDLSAGEQYRLVFVTSTARDGASPDIGVYNSFVTSVAASVAELNALGTGWFAIGSTSTVDARDNTGTNPNSAAGVPVYNLNGTRIANDNADLWDGTLLSPIAFTEKGLSANATPWTGTDVDGTANDSGLANLPTPLGQAEPGLGRSVVADVGWIASNRTANHFSNPLYAISGVLTVPVPEPASFALLGLGGLFIGHRNRRKP